MKLRLWKLGSLEHKLMPSREAVQNLTQILMDLPHDEEVSDIVWGPDLQVELIELDDTEMNVVTRDFVLSAEGAKKIQNFVHGLATEQATQVKPEWNMDAAVENIVDGYRRF